MDVEKALELVGQVRACIDGLNTMGVKISGSIDLATILKLFGL